MNYAKEAFAEKFAEIMKLVEAWRHPADYDAQRKAEEALKKSCRCVMVRYDYGWRRQEDWRALGREYCIPLIVDMAGDDCWIEGDLDDRQRPRTVRMMHGFAFATEGKIIQTGRADILSDYVGVLVD